MVDQVIMGNVLSRYQASSTSTQVSQMKRETPLQVSTALAVHQESRSLSTVELLNRVGVSISYRSLLRHETALAHAVLAAGRADGAFVPRRLPEEELVHFSIDNIDFQEDTIDGKNILHATATWQSSLGVRWFDSAHRCRGTSSSLAPFPLKSMKSSRATCIGTSKTRCLPSLSTS